MTGVVIAQGAVVGYDDRAILRGVDLTVKSGEVVAILGANGSGKSTMVKAILGLVPIVAGAINLFGSPLTHFTQWYRIGYVPQRVGAGSGVPATVGEVVSSGRLARRGFLRPGRARDKQAVMAALEAVGLADRVRDTVSTLSGGQQQRTLIARALAGEPDLLVLDEPTAGVDAASQAAFATALRTFVDGGGTVLLVAHELGPLHPLIDRAIVVHNGQIVHDGAPPAPADYHAAPDHDHVHPHPVYDEPRMWGG